MVECFWLFQSLLEKRDHATREGRPIAVRLTPIVQTRPLSGCLLLRFDMRLEETEDREKETKRQHSDTLGIRILEPQQCYSRAPCVQPRSCGSCGASGGLYKPPPNHPRSQCSQFCKASAFLFSIVRVRCIFGKAKLNTLIHVFLPILLTSFALLILFKLSFQLLQTRFQLPELGLAFCCYWGSFCCSDL